MIPATPRSPRRPAGPVERVCASRAAVASLMSSSAIRAYSPRSTWISLTPPFSRSATSPRAISPFTLPSWVRPSPRSRRLFSGRPSAAGSAKAWCDGARWCGAGCLEGSHRGSRAPAPAGDLQRHRFRRLVTNGIAGSLFKSRRRRSKGDRRFLGSVGDGAPVMRLRFVVTTEKHFRACLGHGVLGLPEDSLHNSHQGDLVAFMVDGAVAGLAALDGRPRAREAALLGPRAISLPDGDLDYRSVRAGRAIARGFGHARPARRHVGAPSRLGPRQPSACGRPRGEAHHRCDPPSRPSAVGSDRAHRPAVGG